MMVRGNHVIGSIGSGDGVTTVKIFSATLLGCMH